MSSVSSLQAQRLSLSVGHSGRSTSNTSKLLEVRDHHARTYGWLSFVSHNQNHTLDKHTGDRKHHLSLFQRVKYPRGHRAFSRYHRGLMV